jgi:hypothetical protein
MVVMYTNGFASCVVWCMYGEWTICAKKQLIVLALDWLEEIGKTRLVTIVIPSAEGKVFNSGLSIFYFCFKVPVKGWGGRGYARKSNNEQCCAFNFYS